MKTVQAQRTNTKGKVAKYALRRLGIGPTDRVAIAKARYEEIALAQRGLTLLLEIERRYELLLANFYDVEVGLLDSTFRGLAFHDHSQGSWEVERLNQARRVINFLGTVKMYASHVPQFMNKAFGRGSAQSLAFIEAKAKAEATSEYRMVAALRNFVQHRGMPVHGSSYETKRMDDSKLRYVFTTYLDVDELGDDERFQKEALTELRTLGRQIELKTLFRQYMAAAGAFHKATRLLISPQQAAWADAILLAQRTWSRRRVREARKEKAGDDLQGVVAVREEDRRFHHPIPIKGGALAELTRLQKKNSDLVNMPLRYVSGEALGHQKR